MTGVRIDLGERSYDVSITTGDPAGVGPFVRGRVKGDLAFVVSDANTGAHANRVDQALRVSGFRIVSVGILPGEERKCLASASDLYDDLVAARADRKTVVVAVGGGVIGDLAGFVAATFNRGLALVMVPTTLLAMVDSSVGGKVGVNHPRGKNLIGAFHQPACVWIDTATLDTLPQREFTSGLAEVVKYGVILDSEFFAYLEANADAVLSRSPDAIRHVVARSCRLKADVVEKDERELTGLRAVLNYGHTFAHSFETVAGYGTWLHGEAVAAGMVCASRLAERRGLIPEEVTRRQVALLRRFGLPTRPGAWPVEELVAAMRGDKKAEGGRPRFVLPLRIGEVGLYEVGEDEVREVLRESSD